MLREGTQRFHDPGPYQRALLPLRLDLVVTAGRAFRAELTGADLDGLKVLHAIEALPRIGWLRLPTTHAFIGFPIEPRAPQIWGGLELHHGDLVLFGKGTALHHRTTGACRWGLLALRRRKLIAWLQAIIGQGPELSGPARLLRPLPADAQELLHLHAEAIRLTVAEPATIAHPEVRHALAQGLIHTLVRCLTSPVLPVSQTAWCRHAAIMQRFEEALRQHPELPASLPALADVTCTPERTLRICCTATLGLGPTRYRWLRRLNAARAALIRADPATATVAAIAKRCGFTELGRFASSYRAIFGELPSATLRAGRIVHCRLGSRSADSA